MQYYMMSIAVYEPGGHSRESGKAIIFQANAKFLRQKPAAKKFKNISLYLLNEKNGIHSILQDEVPKIWDSYRAMLYSAKCGIEIASPLSVCL